MARQESERTKFIKTKIIELVSSSKKPLWSREIARRLELAPGYANYLLYKLEKEGRLASVKEITSDSITIRVMWRIPKP